MHVTDVGNPFYKYFRYFKGLLVSVSSYYKLHLLFPKSAYIQQDAGRFGATVSHAVMLSANVIYWQGIGEAG